MLRTTRLLPQFFSRMYSTGKSSFINLISTGQSFVTRSDLIRARDTFAAAIRQEQLNPLAHNELGMTQVLVALSELEQRITLRRYVKFFYEFRNLAVQNFENALILCDKNSPFQATIQRNLKTAELLCDGVVYGNPLRYFEMSTAKPTEIIYPLIQEIENNKMGQNFQTEFQESIKPGIDLKNSTLNKKTVSQEFVRMENSRLLQQLREIVCSKSCHSSAVYRINGRTD